MTMPHLTNCSHSPEGWCLGCVATLHAQVDDLRKAAQAIVDACLAPLTNMAALGDSEFFLMRIGHIRALAKALEETTPT